MRITMIYITMIFSYKRYIDSEFAYAIFDRFHIITWRVNIHNNKYPPASKSTLSIRARI